MKKFKSINLIFILVSLILLVGCKKEHLLIPKEINHFNEIKKVKDKKYINKFDGCSKYGISSLSDLTENVDDINYYLVNIITDMTDDSYQKNLFLELKHSDNKKYSFKTVTNNELTLKDIKYREVIIATNKPIDDIYVLDRFGQKIPLKEHNLKYFEKFLHEMDNLKK